MKGSFFQRHLVNEGYASQKVWEQQEALEAPAKPENAEFELWTTDIDPRPLSLGPVGYERGLWNTKGSRPNGAGLVERKGKDLNGLQKM